MNYWKEQYDKRKARILRKAFMSNVMFVMESEYKQEDINETSATAYWFQTAWTVAERLILLADCGLFGDLKKCRVEEEWDRGIVWNDATGEQWYVWNDGQIEEVTEL